MKDKKIKVDKIESALINCIDLAIQGQSSRFDIFNTVTKTQLLDACVDYLKYNGYRVIYPTTDLMKFKVTDIDSLITYFYAKLNRLHSNEECVYTHVGRDRSIAKDLIESRIQTTGFSRAEAIKECVMLIDTVFKFEEEFNFKYNLNFSIFSQDNQSWITAKALEIMNRERLKREEIELEELHERVIASRDHSQLGIPNLEELVARINEEENNGK